MLLRYDILIIRCNLGGKRTRSYRPALVLFVVVQILCLSTVNAIDPHVSAPVKINLMGKMLATKYPNTNPGGNSLWIEDTPSWTQYIEVHQGETPSLIAISPDGGNGYLTEMHNGSMYNSSFYFYPNSILDFYADSAGQHAFTFTINGMSSNQVVINVTHYVPPQCYPVPNYYLPYYYYGYRYPYYGFGPRYWGGRYWYHGEYPWLNAP